MIEIGGKELEYNQVGFIVVGAEGYRNAMLISSKKQYDSLINFAREKRYYVYYGKLNGMQIELPYFLDVASLKHKPIPKIEPIVQEPPKSKEPVGKIHILSCPVCKKICNSSSGLTLHMKSCKK